jgi:hypothetical protein
VLVKDEPFRKVGFAEHPSLVDDLHIWAYGLSVGSASVSMLHVGFTCGMSSGSMLGAGPFRIK